MLRRQRGGITWEASAAGGRSLWSWGWPGSATHCSLCDPHKSVPSRGHGLISEASGRFTFRVYEVAPSQTSPVMTHGLCPWVGRSILGEDSQAHEKERRNRGSWLERGLILPEPSQRLALFAFHQTQPEKGEEKEERTFGTTLGQPQPSIFTGYLV